MPTPKKCNLTYRDLRLQGFSGTRYDAEMLIAQGLPDFPRFIEPAQPMGSESSAKCTGLIIPKSNATTCRQSRRDQSEEGSLKRGRLGDVMDELNVTSRSLRSTPGRLRARCERGRATSDSSSGISDDASSNSSGSDRDSGIETGAEFEPLTSSIQGAKSAQCWATKSDVCLLNKGTETKNLCGYVKEALESVKRMNLGENGGLSFGPTSTRSSLSPSTTCSTVAATDPPLVPYKRMISPTRQRVKLTLRMKRSPVLDEVLDSGSTKDMEVAYSSSTESSSQRQRSTISNIGSLRAPTLQRSQKEPEYEVLKMEGIDESYTPSRKNVKRRLIQTADDLPLDYGCYSPNKRTRRVKLLLGKETLSTFDLVPDSSLDRRS